MKIVRKYWGYWLGFVVGNIICIPFTGISLFKAIAIGFVATIILIIFLEF